jgi:PAS domain S-box-containing protein
MGVEGSQTPPQPGQIHFLLVEDNPVDVELLHRELRRAGFNFTSTVVQTEADFTREVRANRPQMVLADYSLPQWRGLEAVEVLRREKLDVPLILVSGSLGEVNAVECLKQGATDYVLKGTLTRLPVAIRRALEERRLREQRKQAEDALHQSEERFQALANGIPQLAWMAEPDGHIFWYNQRWYEYTGTTFEQVQGWGWQTVHDPEILPKVMERWQGSIASGQDFDMEFPLRGVDGTFARFLTRVTPVKDAEGRVVRWFGTNTDVTALKRAEETASAQAQELWKQAELLAQSRVDLEAQTRMLKLVLDSMGEGLVAADRDGRFLIWNDSARKLLGRDAADIPTEEWTPYYHVYLSDGVTPYPPERLPLVRALAGESVQEELLIRNPDGGGDRFLEVTARPLKDDQGNLCGAVAAMRDITEQKLANDLFRRAVEASPGGILMVAAAGEILLANAEAERLFGYAHGELLGQSVEKLVPGRFRQAHAEHRAGYNAAPVRRRVEDRPELYGLRKNGSEFPLEIGLNPVQTASGTQTLIAVVDVTARKEAERAAAEYTRELQRSNAELEQFAYIAAHDLQEPLRMVASYTELLRERYQGKLDEKADKYIGYAVDGAQRMQHLLNDLLAYSRVGTRAKALQPTDAEAVLTAVLRGLQKAVESNQAVIVREKLPLVQADEVQLGQVFQNLIGNALKFHGERVPQIRVSAEAVGKMVRFAVADNGIGMEKESSGRIFQMFQRLHTRDEYDGSGIGLAIAKKIVERHGGEIWFESVPGQGTTFYFTIGAAASDASTASRASAVAAG